MIDIHLATNNRRPEYLAIARDSCLGVAGFSLQEFPETPTLFETRMKGYGLGSGDYVSYIDYDDRAVNLEYIGNVIVPELKTGALCTNSSIINKHGVSVAKLQPRLPVSDIEDNVYSMKVKIHQLVVVRRSIMEKALVEVEKIFSSRPDLSNAVDRAIFWEVALLTRWTYVPTIHYEWRQYSSEQLSASVDSAYGEIGAIYREKFIAAGVFKS